MLVLTKICFDNAENEPSKTALSHLSGIQNTKFTIEAQLQYVKDLISRSELV